MHTCIIVKKSCKCETFLEPWGLLGLTFQRPRCAAQKYKECSRPRLSSSLSQNSVLLGKNAMILHVVDVQRIQCVMSLPCMCRGMRQPRSQPLNDATSHHILILHLTILFSSHIYSKRAKTGEGPFRRDLCANLGTVSVAVCMHSNSHPHASKNSCEQSFAYRYSYINN